MLDCKLDRHILLIGAEMFNICTFFVRCSSSKSSNSDEWKARTWNSGLGGDRSSRLRYWWLVNTTVNDDFQITQLFLNWMSKLVQTVQSRHVCLPSFNYCFSFATILAANFVKIPVKFSCGRFGIMPEIVSKLLLTAAWSCFAVLVESEKTLFSRTGRWLKSAALHRIQFRTCGFVPIPCFT